MAKKPKPIEVGGARASAIRGPKNGRWYWRARRKGARDTVWTGWATRHDAQVALAALVSRGLPSKPVGPEVAAVRTAGDLLQAWSDAQTRREAAGDIAPRTAAKYRQVAAYWVDGFDDVLVGRVTRAMVEDVVIAWMRDGVSPRTLDLAVGTLSRVYVWGERRGHCAALDLRGVAPKVKPDEYVYVSRTPTPAEVVKVLEQLSEGPRRDALELQAITGARVGEVSALRNRDYDPVTGLLTLSGKDPRRHAVGKTGSRTFPLPPRGRELVLRHWTRDEPDGNLLGLPGTWPTQAGKILDAGCSAAKVERFSTHGLRRMVVHRMLDRGIDPKTASRLTGHSVETMLKAYVRPTDDQLRDAVNRAGLGSLGDGGKVYRLDGGGDDRG